jgi:hypothetical protein
VLFADAPVMLLVDPADPAMAELVRRAEAGELSYPDERTRMASLTWLNFHAVAEGRVDPLKLLILAQAALAAGPDPTLCGLAGQVAAGSPGLTEAGIRLLEELVERLAPLDPLTAPDGERVLATRRAARSGLAALYQRAGQPDQAAAAAAAAEQDAALLARLQRHSHPATVGRQVCAICADKGRHSFDIWIGQKHFGKLLLSFRQPLKRCIRSRFRYAHHNAGVLLWKESFGNQNRQPHRQRHRPNRHHKCRKLMPQHKQKTAIIDRKHLGKAALKKSAQAAFRFRWLRSVWPQNVRAHRRCERQRKHRRHRNRDT